MSSIRKIDLNKDYNTLLFWWDKYKMTPPPVAFLPNIGYIYEDVFAVFLYTTNSKLASIMFPVSNKDASKEDKDLAVISATQACEDEARDLGYEYITLYTENENMVERYKKMGYLMGDPSMTNLFIRL